MYPERVARSLQRAKLNMDEGNPELAVADLERAVEKSPKGFDAWFLLGQAKIMLQDFDSAQACLKKAARYDAANPDMWFNLGITYSARNKFTEAIPCYETAVRNAQSPNADAINNLGSCLMSLSRFDEAVTVFESLLPLRETADIHALLGMSHDGAGDYEKAISAYRNALDKGINNFTVNLNLSTCYLQRKDFAQTVFFAERALAIKPKDPQAQANIKRCRKEQRVKRWRAIFGGFWSK